MSNGSIRVIIVGTDFSPASNSAFVFSINLAKQLHASVIAIFVKNADDLAIAMRQNIQVFRKDPKLREKVNSFIDRKFQELTRNVRNDQVRFVVAEGRPWQQILKLAKKEKADLIVTGTRSRSSISRFVLGSTAQKLIVSSFCPVVTVNSNGKPKLRH